MSTLATNAITDASGGNTATINSYTPTESNMAGRNRIINGDMRIDQRNAGASVTGTNYVVDRWQTAYDAGPTVTSQRSTTAPAGFVNSTILTVTASASPSGQATFRQYIEGFNAADFGWGSASAQTVTLSFWVRSSVTGTYAVAFQNAAFNRSYVATYTVNAANTYEYKTVTIAGDTLGTWATDNTTGVRVFFDLGCTTSYNTTAGAWGAGQYFRTSSCVNLIANSGATFYITGVQLEAGSVATPFERRPYGTELQLAQRYFQTGRIYIDTYRAFSGAWSEVWPQIFATEMRATPTMAKVTTHSTKLLIGHDPLYAKPNGFSYWCYISATGQYGADVTWSANSEL